MAELDDRAYDAHMAHLSDDDRRRVRVASRTGAVPDDARLAALASETRRRERRSAGMLCLVLLAQAVIVAFYFYIGRDTGVLPAWAIVGFAVVSAGFSVFNGLRWLQLHRVPPQEPDPLTVAALQREASRIDSRTDPQERPGDAGDR